jgi:hypothetical protein
LKHLRLQQEQKPQQTPTRQPQQKPPLFALQEAL